MEKKYCTAVVLAGGSGKRMGTKVHKQYLMLVVIREKLQRLKKYFLIVKLLL